MESGKTIRVVVVDDSSTYRDALCAFLKTLDRIEVVGTAENGIELLKKVTTLQPDLVITDLHMPRMGGLEVTLRLREQMPATRFIVFTDMDFPFTEAECRQPGADFYLYKENMPERIVTAINRLFPWRTEPEARRVEDLKLRAACSSGC